MNRAGRILHLPTMAGFEWTLEWEIWDHLAHFTSEVVYVSLSPISAKGGSYYIQHDSEDGRWFAYEMGGAGPMIWERPVAHGVDFPSPLAAMLAVKRDYNREMKEQIKAEEQMERFFEEEQRRAGKHGVQGPEPEGIWLDEMGF